MVPFCLPTMHCNQEVVFFGEGKALESWDHFQLGVLERGRPTGATHMLVRLAVAEIATRKWCIFGSIW